MKKLLLVAAFVAASMSAYAQGTIVFNNRVTGSVDAPVSDVGGATKLSGTGFWAQLYAGPAGAADSALTAVGSPVNFRTGNAAGYVVTPGEVSINGVGAGASAQLQLRAWEGAFTSFAAAVAGGGKFGSSESFLSPALGGTAPGGGPPATSPNLVGLKAFSLVPEPSTIALGAIGAAALLFRRRK